ncbi:hypothetical protein CR970_03250 [Candidatus Saccharibacteria bacterium]|nr:MAG: hypothetical protein CR970_03250 [Candidatus Saccharibacteria bacterium]
MKHTKFRDWLSLPRILALGALLALLLLGARQSTTDAQAVTQGFATDVKLQRGMLIQVKQDDATKVEPASQQSAERLHGVVVNPNDAPVTLSAEGEKAFVATTGRYETLVSNQNGPIESGDYITIASVDGIGMKAGEEEPMVIGRALDAFDGSAGALSTIGLQDSAGGSREVAIGRVTIDVGVARNPLLKAKEPNLPGFLKRVSESIAGKPVNPVRVYIAVAVFVVSAIISTSLLIGGVRSALISIGRNPLSKKTIIRGMLQVIMVGVTIFILGLIGVYLLLKV